MAEPGFWDAPERASKVVQELKFLKGRTGPLLQLVKESDDAVLLLDLADEANDEATREEASREADRLTAAVDQLEFKLAMSDKHDVLPCFLSVQAGTGGTDAADWAAMLVRMYLRFAERRGWDVEEIENLPAEEAGIRRATYKISGDWAFGHLRNEIGTHRLVRLSPFDANQRRQTSFAAVDVVPELEELDIKIEDKDLRIDTMRAGGAGGQHVNKTESAVRITHIPSGLVVACQSERSQHKNRATAMQLLMAKLVQRQKMEREKELRSAYDEKGEIGFGYQRRSYVLHPYQLVKDLVTDFQTSDTEGVLDGEIDAFIDASLRKKVDAGGGKAGA
ncbi:MAG: Peptide chain release factor RF2 [Planctomycetes bacterium]|nr:Peptide chain release factor RF2 [Planctomycetota bacterium]